MEFREVLEIVKAGYEKAFLAQSSHDTPAGIEALQGVATVINSELGATDEVAADSPEAEEKSEEVEITALPGKYVQIHEYVREAEIAFAAGIAERGIEHLGTAADLMKEILTTETR